MIQFLTQNPSQIENSARKPGIINFKLETGPERQHVSDLLSHSNFNRENFRIIVIWGYESL